MTRALWLIPFVVACGGEVDSEPVSNAYKLLECGALPDPATCVESERRVDENGCRSLLCEGWPDNPYGQTPSEFYQVLTCNGVRGVNSRVSGDELCRDRWK